MPFEADGGRTENVIYIVIAARWRPAEVDGGLFFSSAGARDR